MAVVKSASCCLLGNPTLLSSIHGTRLTMLLTAVAGDPVPRPLKALYSCAHSHVQTCMYSFRKGHFYKLLMNFIFLFLPWEIFSKDWKFRESCAGRQEHWVGLPSAGTLHSALSLASALDRGLSECLFLTWKTSGVLCNSQTVSDFRLNKATL